MSVQQKTAASPSSSESQAWHTLPAEAVIEQLQTDLANGLTAAEAARRLTRYGSNALATAKRRSTLSIFVDQFKSLIVVLLVVATAVAIALDEPIEAAAIFVVIILNALIGFFTELRAEQALTALQKQMVPSAHVVRDGAESQIPAAEVVPGDVVILDSGTQIPADGRIVENARLQTQEAALTGESLPINKSIEPLEDAGVPLGDRLNMAYMGTFVTDGRGRMVVTATGAQTEIGKIGTLIEGAETQETPLEGKLRQLGRALIGIVLILCVVIVAAGYLRGHTLLYMLEIGISLAIAAIPEGLPAVATMTLAIGVQRMAKQRALIRRLPAVETLGSTTVICTDKTGTLTENEMTVQTFVLGDRRIRVTGSGYTPEGEFFDGDSPVDPQADAALRLALEIGVLCSDAVIERKNGQETVLGDPTEGALITAAEKARLDPAALKNAYKRLTEVPFDSVTKRMATANRAPDGKIVAYLKGGPGAILDISSQEIDPQSPPPSPSERRGEILEKAPLHEGERPTEVPVGGLGVRATKPLTDERRQQILDMNRELAAAALRVLALAYRELPDNYEEADLTRDVTFVGLVGMIDPLREEAKDAIETCRQAGIRTIMLTGDQPNTAAEIARQLGLDRDAEGKALQTIHARDLESGDLKQIVASAGVFARVSPKDKLEIVDALQQEGHIVAMTGDGVNDAPALKKADIGVAMGIKGTEVAKETAAMIITDDDFATIVSAIEQGRIIYANIQKFIHFLFSCNFAEILTIFAAIMIGWPLPLAPLQILWLNIITDVFPALALALEPSVPRIMQRPPRDPKEELLNVRFAGLVAWQGLLLAVVTLIAFVVGMNWYGREGEGLRHASTLAFMTLALAQVFHAFNVRSTTRSIFTEGLFTNRWLWGAVIACILLQLAVVYLPFLQLALNTVALNAADWGVIALSSLLPIAVVEMVKLIQRGFANE